MHPSIAILLLTVASFILGFGRDIAIAYTLGGSWMSDGLFLALTLPAFFENIVGIALRDTMIPYLKAISLNDARAYRDRINRLGMIILCIGLGIMSIIALLPRFWVEILAPGWSLDQTIAASRLFVVSAISVLVMVWSYFLTAILNSEGRLVVPVWRSILFNLGAILMLIIRPGDAMWVMIGMVAGQIVHVLWMQILVGPRGIGFSHRRSSSDAGISSFLSTFAPLFGATVAVQVNVLAERFFASWMSEGSVSFLSYAYRTTTIPVVLFTFAILTVVYPLLVTRHLQSDEAEFNRLVRDSMRITMLALIPASVFFIMLAAPVVRLLFQHGSFNAAATDMTAKTMIAYALGLPAMGMALLGSRIAMALGKGRTVLMAALITMIVTISVDILTYRRLGTVGLALAATCGALFQAGILWAMISKYSSLHALWPGMIKWGLSVLPAVGILFFWAWDGPVGLVAAGVVTVSVIIMSMWLLGEKWVLSRQLFTWERVA